MTRLLAITYRSKASRDLGPQELDGILTSARAFNADCGVTGGCGTCVLQGMCETESTGP